METIIVGIIAVVAGFAIAKIVEKNQASNTLKNVKKQAGTILKEANIEAEGIKKDKILQAKEKFIELKAEHEKVILAREKKISEADKRVRDKESLVSQELDKNKRLNKLLEDKEISLEQRMEFIEKKKAEIEKLHKSQVVHLETISGLSGEEAKKELLETLKEEAKADAMAFIQNAMEEAKLTVQQDSKKIILNTIHRE